MKLLLDECTPKRLKRDFAGHDSFTVDDVGSDQSPITVGDSLATPPSEHFDQVLTNPPFAKSPALPSSTKKAKPPKSR